MSEVRTILLNKSIAESLEEEANELRNELRKRKMFVVNVMSSPGSGKTTTLIQIVNRLKEKYKLAIMEADIDSDVDARRVAEATGVKSIQLHTGGMCHLDASMTRQGLDGLEEEFDFVFLENIGNLVCPAEFDTGASLNLVILSVPEGSDKPLKYPLMFEKSDIVLINKIDTIDYFDFDYNIVSEFIYKRNKNAKIFKISAKLGDGIDEVIKYLIYLGDEWRK